MVVSVPPLFPLSNQKPAGHRSYPLSQRPQSADRQNIAEEGDWPTAPRDGSRGGSAEHAQTAPEGGARHLQPESDDM